MAVEKCEQCGVILDERAHTEACPTRWEARIRVYQPGCTCGCAATRWFYCTRLDARFVQEYTCLGYADCPLAPVPRAIAEVSAQHPGCELVYID